MYLLMIETIVTCIHILLYASRATEIKVGCAVEELVRWLRRLVFGDTSTSSMCILRRWILRNAVDSTRRDHSAIAEVM